MPGNIADILRDQFAIFVSAPFVIAPLIIFVVTATWWLTSQFNKSAIEAYKAQAKTAADQAKATIEAAEAAARIQVAIQNDRIKFAEEKEADLRKKFEDYKASVEAKASQSTIDKKADSVNAALDEYSTANNRVSSASKDTEFNVLDAFKDAATAVSKMFF